MQQGLKSKGYKYQYPVKNALIAMQVHQSIIHNFVIQASFQTNWQQDKMRPVALIPEGNNGFPRFLHLFLNWRLKDSRNIIYGSLLQICNRLGLKHSANDSAVHY